MGWIKLEPAFEAQRFGSHYDDENLTILHRILSFVFSSSTIALYKICLKGDPVEECTLIKNKKRKKSSQS
jgi:hypothetical protein